VTVAGLMSNFVLHSPLVLVAVTVYGPTPMLTPFSAIAVLFVKSTFSSCAPEAPYWIQVWSSSVMLAGLLSCWVFVAGVL